MKSKLSTDKDKEPTLSSLINSIDELNYYYKLLGQRVIINERGDELDPFIDSNNEFQMANKFVKRSNADLIIDNIKLLSKFDSRYTGGGNEALIDKIIGGKDDISNFWQGYLDQNVSVIIGLESSRKIDSINVNFLNNPKVNIYLPSQVNFYYSSDGINFNKVLNKDVDSEKLKLIFIDRISVAFPYKTKYIKIEALKREFPFKAWIFTDEITVK
ncbi:F5/8 type C domain protein [compost metagenome]